MLQLIDIHSGYQKTEVLHGINLQIQEGEMMSIIGLNGAGKSTLLKTCLGLINPIRGKIILRGKDLPSWNLADRAKNLSLLDTQTKASFSMSVSELLDLCDGDANRKVEALRAVGLDGFQNKNILHLSSGERQRAFIAHILASNAKIIMIDEPFTHLDWKHQQELSRQFKNWQKRYGTTFILSIHELERAVQISDRILVLHEGCILALDKPEAVFCDPQVLQTFAFQAAIDENPFDGSKRLTLGTK